MGGGLGRDRLADRFGGGQVFKDVDSIQLIEAALTRNERVIPILVEGAPMPPPEELPESLTRLVRRQALELSPERFEFDTNRLLKVLETTLRLGRGPAPSTGRAGAARPGPGCWPGSASPSRWSWWPASSWRTCGRRRKAAGSRSTRPRRTAPNRSG